MALVKDPVVAFQGERGAYSEIAATRFFGKRIPLVPCVSFERPNRTQPSRQSWGQTLSHPSHLFPSPGAHAVSEVHCPFEEG
jgi:hypothetical protein